MLTLHSVLRSLALIVVAAATSITHSAEPTPEQVEFFEAKIRPVLVKHCYECHSAKVAAPRGGLRLDDREAVLKGGDSGPSVVSNADHKKSPLMQALRYDGLEMPPKGKLPEAVIADFEQWVKMGAPDPRASVATKTTSVDPLQIRNHWAFQRPVAQPVPTVKNKQWPTNDVDRFILAKLDEHTLQPAPAADRRTLLRRAYYDLIGLPPEPEKVAAFVNDPAGDHEAFAKVVDELLLSPHYGERWARYWLDIARYAEDQAHTFKARRYPQGYLYRDWVVGALNSDLPYDAFLMQQIAGDLLNESPQPKHERIKALGLFALGPVYYQDNGEKDKALADEWDDRVDVLVRGTQALTISCARCHDHKFDPISMADYYGLLGVFASTQYQERAAAPEDVVRAKQTAEAVLKEQQLEVDRFLMSQAREVREQLVPDISKYVVAAWQMQQLAKSGNDKKALNEVVKQTKLNEDLLKRWASYLDEKRDSGAIGAERPYLANWRQLRNSQDKTKDLSQNEAAKAAVTAIGDALQQRVMTLLPHRSALLKQFGEDAAFIAESDRATVATGQIPLGNLFDDAKGASLANALASDTFRAAANESNLGVARVAQGWGQSTSIATGINFDFLSLGSDDRSHGAIINDGWDATGGISTKGKSANSKLPRTEQGIGMHANALVTFDLNEIRRAGLIPVDRPLTLKIDRAGLNDDVFGSGTASVHLAVIVSKPQSQDSEFDSVLSATLNGQQAKVVENDGSYYFAGPLPEPMTANGKFFEVNLKLPVEAQFVTLVTTGAGKPDDNSISSDHAVFSGARLEYEPPVTANDNTQVTRSGTTGTVEKLASSDTLTMADGLLFSELFSDKGLLALPSKDVGGYLKGESAEQLKALNQRTADAKKAADAINVPMAHSLGDGPGMDLPIYLAGDPRKKGPLAARAFPAVLSGGERQRFESPGSGRLDLARAIAVRSNPLTARVWVNRVWAGHFGSGLVRTPSNFGTLGEKPSHPELLDWLAVKFMDAGWSTKWLHRQIMLSSTYRLSSGGALLSSQGPDAITTTDPENRLLSRMPRRRLEVEPWRDSVLAVTGTLDRSLGGPSRNLESGNRRRTLYGFISRHQLDELLRLFDFPDPNITAGQRTVTTVPLQQLFVLNSEFIQTQARALAARLQKEASTDEARVQRAFQLLFNRAPTASESQLAQEFLSAPSNDSKLSNWEQYALVLLGSNEFLFVD